MNRNRFTKILATVTCVTLALLFLLQPMTFTIDALDTGLGNHAPMAPSELLTNESEHPMNIEGIPMFDWWVNDEDYDEVQTAYEIRVYDGVTDELVWDSGKVLSSMQNCVPYTGEKLKSGYPYSWEVKTWDSRDFESPYSERAEFSTGLLDDEWDAKWIQGIYESKDSPLSIIEEEVEDVILSGEGFALESDYAEWKDYSVSTKLTVIGGGVGIAFRTSLDEKTGYVWQFVPTVGLVRNKLSGGTLSKLGNAIACKFYSGKEHDITVSVSGNVITTTLDGEVIDKYEDTNAIPSGTFGFYTENGEKTRLHSLSATETTVTKELSCAEGIALYKNGTEWTDYTIDFDMVIHKGAAGIMFRSATAGDGYMWQFNLSKGGLARHIGTGSKFTKLDGNCAIKCTLVAGQKHHVRIVIAGNVFTTYLDGNLINTYEDETYSVGSFAIRQGGNETATFSNIRITDNDGVILARESTEVKDNYSKPALITVTDADLGGYSTTFTAEELKSFRSTKGTLPITSGTQKVYWAESNGDGVTMLNYGLDWEDYTISLDVQVTKTSAGVVFRAPDGNNSGYMWAIRSDGKLRMHKGANGKYARIGTTANSDFSLGLKAGVTYHLSVTVSGDTITTFVDGKQVNQRTSDVSFIGAIGFRTDSNECGRYTNVTVTDPSGKILFADDFKDGAVNWGTSGALNAENSYWYNRKETALDSTKEVKHAVAYVSGSQDYELTVNGVRIGRAQSYDYLGETRYQGWDITDAVAGKDKIAIGVLASYFGDAQGRAGSMPGLLGKFIIYYTDGTKQTIVTDNTWVTHSTGYSNLGKRNGEGDEIEYCDARLMLEGWAEIGYDTKGWVPVIVHGAHPTSKFTNLEPEVGHVKETLVSAVSVKVLNDGTTVADFGKVIPARVIIHFPDGVDGTVITVQEGYELLTDGSINTSKDSTQSTNMTYVYTMKEGEQTFRAWGYLGFRYVSVPKEAGTLTADDFKATILHAEVVEGRESTLDTSDDMLNEVFLLMQRSALYSVQNQFVDTPTREKGQFLQDTINISAATMSGSYERQMTKKAILQFLASSDRHWPGTGRYTAVYPNNDGARDIPEFTLSVPIFVWRYYIQTGDKDLLLYAYPYMKNTAAYVANNTNSTTGLVTAIEGGGTSSSYQQGIIDTPPDRFGYDTKGTLNGVRTTINAHCVRVYDVVATMARELGYTTDASLYDSKADALRTAMNKYLVTDSGLYCDGLTPDGVQSTHLSQHATSHAIMAGVPTDDMLDTMLDYIAGLGMRQGTTTADILLEALFENGRGDAAVRLLTNVNDYGWAKIINRGYTFIWENWHGSGSQSHGWGAASLWQVIEYVSGVKLLEAGAKTIRIDPAEGNVDLVNSHTVTARGAVDISYSGSGKDYVITIDVPANMTAEVVFPIVTGGSFVEVSGKDGASELTEDGQVITVGSGKRTFVFSEVGEEHTYESIITPPTCTERGYTQNTCTSCGASYKTDYVEALGHSYNEYERCTVCEVKITGASVRLGQDLAVKYYVNIIDKSILKSGGLAMAFSISGREDVVVTDYKVEGGRYTFIYEGIAPQQMADNITATLMYKRGETYKPLDKKADYSIKDNCVNLLKKSATELGISEEKYAAMKTLISDMLVYGKATQDYKDHTEGGYATDGIEGLTPSMALPDESDRMSLTGSDKTLYFKSASVRFDTVNKVYINFVANVENDSLVSIKVNGVAYALSDFVALGDGVYKITTGGISACDFDKAITVELLYDGNTVGTLTYSVNAYAYAMSGGEATEKMKALAISLYRYGKSAEAYALAK